MLGKWAEGLKEARDEGTLLDTKIRVGPRTIEAHKLVLVAHSAFLKGLLTGGLAESAAAADGLVRVKQELGGSGGEVVLGDDLDGDVVAAIVDCFYSGQIAMSTANVCAFIVHANRLQVGEIEKAACKFFVENLEPETVVDALGFAAGLSESGVHGRELHTSCLNYALKNLVACAKVEEFRQLPYDIIYSRVLSRATSCRSRRRRLCSL